MDMDAAARYGIADGVQALEVVRQRAAQWGVSPDRVGFVGFSAGAMVTSGALLQADAAARPRFAGVYSAGGHGFGLKKEGTTSDHWIDAFYSWLEAQGLTRRAAR